MARRIRDVRLALLLVVLLGARLGAEDTGKTAQLGLIVTDKTNAYVTGAQIKICPHAGLLPKNPLTYQYGTLRLNLVPGSYDLFVASPAFKPWYRQVDLRAESNQTIPAVLEGGARTVVHLGHGPLDPPPLAPEPLKIDVTDEAGVPVAFARFNGFPDINAMADETGELRLKLVPTTYLIAATSPGYERWEKMVEVIAHQDNVVKVALKRIPTS